MSTEPNTIEDAFTTAEDKMKKAIEAEQRELATLRTGRASPVLVEHLHVDYYGAQTSLNQLAAISVPEARLLVIQPWDRQALGSIEKAIQKSDLGINPTNDGTVIRLAFPQLTQERRQQLAKTVRKKVEDGRVALRNVRREAQEALRAMERRKEISEDELKRASEQLQKLLDSYIVKMEQLGKAKETELMEI